MARIDLPGQRSYDAVVVGARCAGAATALLLARGGLRVLVVDRGRYGTDTLSTHALMRAGVLQLRRWGVLDAVRAEGTPTVRTTTFHYGGEKIEIEVRPGGGIDGLYAPRRSVIDRLLVDAARAAGAEVAYGTALVDVLRAPDGRVRGIVAERPDGDLVRHRAELVVGADGLRSTLAGLVGAPVTRQGNHAAAVVFSYWSGTGLEGYHWYYRPGVSAGAISTNGGTCVFAAVPAERFEEVFQRDVAAGYHRVLEECEPSLAAAVGGARRTAGLRGFPGQAWFLRRSHGPGWALVGDAGYFKDPLTAHGMTDALIDAELLARAALAGSDGALAEYEGVRDARAVAFSEVTDAIASFEWDLPEVQELHLSLSEEMKRETAALRELHERPLAAGGRS